MQVIKISQVPAETKGSPIFKGGTASLQRLVTDEMCNYCHMLLVSFPKGVRNKLHTHDTDMLLIVTAGRGIIATESSQKVIEVGDVVHCPAGEKHWHGATDDSDFAHIVIMGPASGAPIALFEE